MFDGWRQDCICPARRRISGVFGSQCVYRGAPGTSKSGIDVAGAIGAPTVRRLTGLSFLYAASPFTLEAVLTVLNHGRVLCSTVFHLAQNDLTTGDIVRRWQCGRVTVTTQIFWAKRYAEERIDPIHQQACVTARQ